MPAKLNTENVTQQLKSFFLEREEIVAVYLFGSALKETNFKDVDFAALCRREFAESPGAFSQVLRWGGEIERRLEPRYPVDIRLLNEAPVHFQHEVISAGVVVFERDRDARVIFEARVLSEYMDYEPTRRFFEQQLWAKIDDSARKDH